MSFVLWWVLPVVALIGSMIAPLASGSRTLFLRDVLNTHYEMKWTQAQAMQRGELPMIDVQRSGGQAHIGNPNTVPLYPDNLLFLFTETLWAMNAHFWLHWLVALGAGAWLGRALGMGREAAWTVGAVYATSGFFLSTLNLYNLVAVVAWAPALLAAALELSAPATRRRGLVAGAAIWALMIFGGDPVTAAVSLAATAVVVAVHCGRRYPWWTALAGVALGTALAAPQWVEFLRILSFTFRGFWGYGHDLATSGGWRPIDALELVLPFPFGRPNLAYWGQHLHADQVPLFFTLSPGVLALALAFAARRGGGRAFAWAWGLVLVGGFLALGEANPLIVAVSKLPGASLLRIPSKLWSLVSLGLAVLAGIAVGQLVAGGVRRLKSVLLLVGALLAAGWATMSLFGGAAEGWIARLLPDHAAAGMAAAERLRWAGLLFLQLLMVVATVVALWLGRRRPAIAGAVLLTLHVASQLFFLRPALETDERAVYLERPALLDEIPAGSRVVYGEKNDLFGPSLIPAQDYADASMRWRERELHASLYPWSGVRGGLIYEFALSPEGLDSFLTRATAQTIVSAPDDLARIRILEASGVDYLLLKRDLDPSVGDRVELAATEPVAGGAMRLYRLRESAAFLEVVGRVRGSANLNEALTAILAPGFDPRRDVVLAGDHPRRSQRGGSARLVEAAGDRLVIDTEAPGDAVLVIQRTHLPIYDVSVDGRPASYYAANLHRLGVPLTAGHHRVEVAVDRSFWYGSLAMAAAALLVLVGIGLRGRSPAGGGDHRAAAC